MIKSNTPERILAINSTNTSWLASNDETTTSARRLEPQGTIQWTDWADQLWLYERPALAYEFINASAFTIENKEV